jgi:chromosomal replication initiator protein
MQARPVAGLPEQLAQDLPEQQFNTWIKPLTAQVAPDFSPR